MLSMVSRICPPRLFKIFIINNFSWVLIHKPNFMVIILTYFMELQGDRTKKVGVIDSEFIVHKGIPSLGGPSANKVLNPLQDAVFFSYLPYMVET